MRQTKTFIPTLKQKPKEAEIKSHILLLRAGFIKQTAAGIYTYLPLGYEVLRKIENVIDNEMKANDISRIQMPVLQPSELWHKTDRWDSYGNELMKFTDRHKREFALGPTHEEVITDLVSQELNSYKKLPLTMYQIQTKFRDELRPRFGLMRGREFSMYDAYSFAKNQSELDEEYDHMYKMYSNIFNTLGLQFKVVKADSGVFGGSESAEFMALSEVGEDTIVYSDNSDEAFNEEVYTGTIDDSVKTAKTIEIGHIYKLGTKYSEGLNAKFLNANQTLEPLIMGCYGIGVSRLLMAIIEQQSDENGIVLPKAIAPYQIHMMFASGKNETQVNTANEVYSNLNSKYDVLFDDRDLGLGVKLKDSELIGMPIRIVFGRDLDNNQVEITNRKTLESKLVNVEDIEVAIEEILSTIK